MNNNMIIDNRLEAERGLVFNEPLLFETAKKGRKAYSLPPIDVDEKSIEKLIPPHLLRKDLTNIETTGWSELDVVRHFVRLSQWNFSVDTNFYPLGSCTMKYNPKVNEYIARIANFLNIHPYQDAEQVQGALCILYELSSFLKEISGMDAVSLQPAAGAHGELTGVKIIKAYLTDRGNPRKKIILPYSAHGTNPSSAVISGYIVQEIECDLRGMINLSIIEKIMDDDVAGLMLTNPNTLGMFEEDILKITKIVHDRGGLVYCDGANLNALMGIVKARDLGIDVFHFNLHKTFSTPHGGGGPGAGPIGVVNNLSDYLPVPLVVKKGNNYLFDYDRPRSIGKVRQFYGNFGVLLKAYSYIRSLGAEGLKEVSEIAVLNANYIKTRLADYYHLPFAGKCLHECVFTDKFQNRYGVTTADIAKTLIDYGFHPPTVYFPLIVKAAITIEPTETESLETLERFINALIDIAKTAEGNSNTLQDAPYNTKVKRLDEVKAVKEQNVRWKTKEDI